jgi:SNF2 family DNA or RNA helicase
VREAERFTPDLVVRRVSATQAASGVPIAESARGAHIVVTSYGLLRLDAEAYREMGRGAEPDGAAPTTVGDGSEGAAGGADGGESGWSALILDEAQFVKNADSLVHRAARDVEAPVVIAVTGTPLENSLTELHALLALTAPGLFPSARAFAQQYVRVIEQPAAGITSGRGAGEAPVASDAHRAEVLARLRRRIRPFLLRRTKEIVAADLPPKTEQTLSIDLTPEHREIYDVYLQRERQKLFGLIEDLDRNRFIVFRSLTLLRLLALDASLVSDEYQGVPSSKLDALVEHLQDVVAEGHRALVFSQFTSYLSIVERRLATEGIETVSLDGSTRDRGGVVDAFRDGDAPVFLISLKAGGFGLNLTEADYVFLLDPWWNPASEAQAVDRAHRIGQDKNVFVYRLIAADTIEEKVLALGERKARLFDSVMDDGSFASTLVADDIRALLG